MLLESGTGGAPKYGVVAQMPLATLEGVNVLDNLTYMQPRIGNNSASIGKYTTNLENGVTVTMAASMHAGLLNYTSTGQKHILVDLSHYLPTPGEAVASQAYINGRIDVSDDGRQYTGYGTWRGGWNEGSNPCCEGIPNADILMRSRLHSLFLLRIRRSTGRLSALSCPLHWYESCLVFVKYLLNSPLDPYWPNTTSATATFVNANTLTGGPPGFGNADRIGAVFTFPSNASTVMSKTGVSWISTDKACQFLEEEIPDWDMQALTSQAETAWVDQVLSKIQVNDTRNDTLLTMFYSALYRTSLLPSNRTGENPYWDDEVGYVDDIYTLWDTFRCLFSLEVLIQPRIATALVQTLISVWRHERFMPDGRSGNYNGRVQGGSNADNILADAYVKNLSTSTINYTAAYMAALTDAEVTPPNNMDLEDPTSSTKEGRGALPDWLDYGFITPNFSRAISKTVEYSLNDFAVFQLARGLSSVPSDAQKYLNRSAGWQRIWSANTTSLNYTGFLAPTYSNGTLEPNLPNGSYTPLSCGECEWDAIAYEALPWEYSWTVPHDMQTLIRLMGGRNRTEDRLDTMFVPGLKSTSVGSGGNNGIGDTIFNPGNEPSFATPFLYNYLGGRQWKSVMRGRETVNQYYNSGSSGIPGNSDAGALDSWLVWNMLGLYSVVTQPVYLILSPWFDDISMKIGEEAEEKWLHITAENLDEAAGSVYVQTLRVNGVDWNRSWIGHEDLMVEAGGNATLEFVLGAKKTQWDTGEVPPSPGHVELDL